MDGGLCMSWNQWSPAVQAAVEDLLWASRILVNEGVLDGFGHVSIRHPENPDRFLQTVARPPNVGVVDDIIEIGLDGTVHTPKSIRPYSERILHGCLLEARPDMNAVCHHHSEAIVPFSCTGVPYRPISHMGYAFWQGVPLYDSYDVSDGMLVVSPREGKRIARCLGQRRGMLMRGHGAMVVAEDIPRLVMSSVYMCRDARMQMASLQLAAATGTQVKFLSEEEGRGACETMLANWPLALGL
jgi:3-hydroxy-2-methylpyridine-4,5-dicarboxylate 4-decarboxylase